MSKTYKDGPIPLEQRSCTDCICFIIFLIVTGVMLGFAIYAWTNGNFKRLRNGYDPDGKGCGIDYPDYPFVYFASPNRDSLWVTVCLSKCPKAGDTTLSCKPNSVVTSCAAVNNPDNTKSVQIYDSKEVLNTVCIPTSATIQENVNEALGGKVKGLASLMENYELILFALPIAIILSLIFMLLVRLTAGCVIYLLILVTIGSLIALGVFLIMSDTAAQYTTQNQTARILLAVGCFLIALLILIMVCCFRKKISLASSIIKVSSRFVTENCLIVVLPIILFVIMIFFLALWILEFLGYYSLGTPSTENHQLPFARFDIPTYVYIIGGFHIFYLFWTLLFLIDTGSFIVGGAACSWYYHQGSAQDSAYSQASARYRTKHIGSVALGSFFLALLGFIKLMYDILTPDAPQEGSILASLKKCCDCFCCICTAFLFKCFNNGAYTVINLVGDPYCTSAATAFEAKLKNLGSSTVVAIVQIIFTVLIRLGITFLTALIIYAIIKFVPSYAAEVTDATLILVVSGLAAFTISCFFISVYSDAIDAIYTTYTLDVAAGGQLNDFCPQELKDFIDEAQRQQHIINK